MLVDTKRGGILAAVPPGVKFHFSSLLKQFEVNNSSLEMQNIAICYCCSSSRTTTIKRKYFKSYWNATQRWKQTTFLQYASYKSYSIWILNFNFSIYSLCCFICAYLHIFLFSFQNMIRNLRCLGGFGVSVPLCNWCNHCSGLYTCTYDDNWTSFILLKNNYMNYSKRGIQFAVVWTVASACKLPWIF